jgi:hypothetical protein
MHCLVQETRTMIHKIAPYNAYCPFLISQQIIACIRSNVFFRKHITSIFCLYDIYFRSICKKLSFHRKRRDSETYCLISISKPVQHQVRNHNLSLSRVIHLSTFFRSKEHSGISYQTCNRTCEMIYGF